ncbi:probable methyltransferase PMT19 isoform X2 [Aristolochia californica]|uniref:probable methyltransferase PMT19 isoform X2 n=1 Tax=Aristolochia californica TaxID=171875 RepID=UPI0035DA6724
MPCDAVFFPLNLCRRGLAVAVFIACLCSFCYYVGLYKNIQSFSKAKASYQRPNCLQFNLSIPKNPSVFLDFETHHRASLPSNPFSDFPPLNLCPENFTHYCPCQDLTRMTRLYSRENVVYKERHCPEKGEVVRCLIPKPAGYRTPFPWPASRDLAWFANVPFKTLTVTKGSQNWVRLEGNKLVFPGGGTSFQAGVKGYVDGIRRFVPLKKGTVRTVLDIGCGVASFGAHLLDYNILTMSVAPRDSHEAQVQFALERGLPAMLGVLSTYRLPFPAMSFDMAHCSRCLIQWTGYDGLYLIEIDRVLRPGGYWVLSGPPISWRNSYKGWETKREECEREQAVLEDLARRLCWKKIAEKGPIAVWQKPTNHLHCSLKKFRHTESPSFCQRADHDAAWYRKLEPCITPLPKATNVKEIAGGALEKWPKRLTSSPPRILNGHAQEITSKMFVKDNLLWNQRVSHYAMVLTSLTAGKYRNIMDMNAGLGGFAAALSKFPVWIMNVIPHHLKNDTLGIIYERGLIGTYMDWLTCTFMTLRLPLMMFECNDCVAGVRLFQLTQERMISFMQMGFSQCTCIGAIFLIFFLR